MNEKRYIEAGIEHTDKGLLAVATSAVQDRHGEVVSVEGWDMKNFKKNPVLLWAHDHTIPAIGVAKNIKVDGVGKKARVLFEPVFHDLTDQAKALKQMVEDKIINSFSVGFRPLEMEGDTYTKQELLEISLVNVPANPEARMLAYKSLKGAGFDDKVISDVVGEQISKFVDGEAESSEIEELKATVAKQQETIDSLVKGLQHLNPQGRKDTVVTQRLALNKVIVRAADKLLEEKPKGKSALYAKIVKRTAEKLIVDQKQELKSDGKN